MNIIAITGTIGAGKGTIVEYLQTKGFAHYSARDFFLKEVRRRNLPETRDNILMIANELRKNHFPGYTIGELLKEAQAHGQDAVIESIRAFGEVDLLKEQAPGFILLAVDADLKVRYDRIVKRGSSTDNVTFEKFVADENKEMDAKEPWQTNIKGCMKQADFLLSNNGSVEELHQKIDDMLAKIRPQ